MALNYHKITFHVEEKETELFSSSAYNEQMSFDKNVLKLNNAEGRRLSLEAKSEASNPKVVKEEPKHNAEKPNPNISDRRKSIENTNPSTVKKRKSIEKSISLGEPTISVGYCICDKPERDDMLGWAFSLFLLFLELNFFFAGVTSVICGIIQSALGLNPKRY